MSLIRSTTKPMIVNLHHKILTTPQPIKPTQGTIQERLHKLLARCLPDDITTIVTAIGDVTRLSETLKETLIDCPEDKINKGFQSISTIQKILIRAATQRSTQLESTQALITQNQAAIDALLTQTTLLAAKYTRPSDTMLAKLLARCLYEHVVGVALQSHSDTVTQTRDADFPARATAPQWQQVIMMQQRPPMPIPMPPPMVMPHQHPYFSPMGPCHPFPMMRFPMIPMRPFGSFGSFGMPMLMGWRPGLLPMHPQVGSTYTPPLAVTANRTQHLPQESQCDIDGESEIQPTLHTYLDKLAAIIDNVPPQIREHSPLLTEHLDHLFPNSFLSPFYQSFNPDTPDSVGRIQFFRQLIEGPFPAPFKKRVICQMFIAVNSRSDSEGLAGAFQFKDLARCISPKTFLALGDKAAWAFRSCLEILDFDPETMPDYNAFFEGLVLATPETQIEAGYAQLTMLCQTVTLHALHEETKQSIFSDDRTYDESSSRKQIMGNIIRQITESVSALEEGLANYQRKEDYDPLVEKVFPVIAKKLWGLLDIIHYLLNSDTTPTKKVRATNLTLKAQRTNLLQLLGNIESCVGNISTLCPRDFHPPYRFRIRYEEGPTAPTMIFSNLPEHQDMGHTRTSRDDFFKRITPLREIALKIPADARKTTPSKWTEDTRDVDALAREIESTRKAGPAKEKGPKAKGKKPSPKSKALEKSPAQPHTALSEDEEESPDDLEVMSDQEWALYVSKASMPKAPQAPQETTRRHLAQAPEEVRLLPPYEQCMTRLSQTHHPILDSLDQIETHLIPDFMTCGNGDYYLDPSLTDDDLFLKVLSARKYIAHLYRLAHNILQKLLNPTRPVCAFDLKVLKKIERGIRIASLATSLQPNLSTDQQRFLDDTFSTDMDELLRQLSMQLIQIQYDREAELADRKAFRKAFFIDHPEFGRADKPVACKTVSPETENFRHVRSLVQITNRLVPKLEQYSTTTAPVKKKPAAVKKKAGKGKRGKGTSSKRR